MQPHLYTRNRIYTIKKWVRNRISKSKHPHLVKVNHRIMWKIKKLSTRIPKSKHPHPSIYCKVHGFSVIICHLCWKWYFNYALDKYAYFDTTFIMLVFIIVEKLTILWNWRMRFLQDAVSRDAVACGCG